MGSNTLTAPAINIPFRREIDTQLKAEAQRIQALELALQQTKLRVSELNVLKQEVETEDRLAAPETLEDLFVDPSYNEDESFRPNPLDEQRLNAFLNRTSALEQTEREVRSARSAAAWAETQQRTLPARIAELQQQIDAMNGSWMKRFFNRFSGKREAYVREQETVKSTLARLPEYLADARIAFERAATRRDLLLRNTSYESALHETDAPATIRHRSQQAVPLTFDSRQNTITLRLPQGPESNDYTVDVTIEFNDAIESDLLRLIGESLPGDGTLYNSLWETVDGRWDLEDQLVPLALEIVEVDGEERYRLPQVVWEKFKDHIS